MSQYTVLLCGAHSLMCGMLLYASTPATFRADGFVVEWLQQRVAGDVEM